MSCFLWSCCNKNSKKDYLNIILVYCMYISSSHVETITIMGIKKKSISTALCFIKFLHKLFTQVKSFEVLQIFHFIQIWILRSLPYFQRDKKYFEYELKIFIVQYYEICDYLHIHGRSIHFWLWRLKIKTFSTNHQSKIQFWL